MSSLKEKIDITPHRSLYAKLGQTGYSVGEAIAELVDNAIDAREKDRPLVIKVKMDRGKKEVIVEDNAKGMDKKTASESIILGISKKQPGQLGEFGLGLKTACSSLGQKFTVQTTKGGSDEEYILVFDEEDFLKSGKWQQFNIVISKGIDKNTYGTKIVIERPKFNFYPALLQKVKDQLQERFAPFIANGEVKLSFNGEWLKEEKPDLAKGTKKKLEVSLSNGEQVKGWVGILGEGSQAKSGFNLYRRKRLIRAHEKLGYAYHPSKMWITGELNLDCIPVTHNKREFLADHPLYVEFLEKFQEKIKPHLAEAQRRHRERNVPDLKEEERETLKDHLLRALNQVADFGELAYPTGADPQKRSEEGGEHFEKEKRERQPVAEVEESQERPKKTKEKSRTPKKTQSSKVRFITIAGQRYKFDYQWDEFEEDIPKIAEIDQQRRMVIVTLNSRFPILNSFPRSALSFYIALYTTEGLVEVFLKENKQGLDRTVVLRDKTIKQLAKIITEDEGEEIMEKEEKMVQAKIALLRDPVKAEALKKRMSKGEFRALEMRSGLEGGPRTLQEIGNELGVTRERARQLIRQAVVKL